MGFTEKRILCTGGLGYIGSHTVVQLLEKGYSVTILDNLAASSAAVLDRIKLITKVKDDKLRFVKVDLLDKVAVKKVLEDDNFEAVIHYAGLKAVEESIRSPLMYYENNIEGCINLLQAMDAVGVRTLVFSSSAAVYAPKAGQLVTEADPVKASNPYGRTKIMIEQILQDLYNADPRWKISVLRYFNPVGAHSSGKMGEYASKPTNILPVLLEVLIGKRQYVEIFGSDWETPDGTGVRDFLHVEDLASGHLAALQKLGSTQTGVFMCHNLGTGKGHSVLELKNMLEKVSRKEIPYRMVDRRPGDLASVVADPTRAQKELDWRATRTIEDACASAWRWIQTNPTGYL